MITQNTGTCAQSEENYGLSCGPGMPVAHADSSNDPIMYICPNDLIIVDPNEYDGIFDLISEIAIDQFNIKFWNYLYNKEPHKIPNHYPPAPKKLEFKSNAPKIIHKNFKQPVSRSGFKKGNRN